jgi:hypothetical protein
MTTNGAHPSTGGVVYERSEELATLYEDLVVLDEVLQRPKVERLFCEGDISEYDDDDNRADQALCSFFGHFTNDREQIDRLYRQSPLMRDKWLRADYRKRTIDKALTKSGEHHESPRVAGLHPVLTRMSDVNATQVEWRWHHRLPLGMLTMISADPGLGKSQATLAIAAAITRGWALPGDQGKTFEPANVLLMAAEDDAARTIKPRLVSVGADMDRIFLLDVLCDAQGKEHAINLVEHMDYLDAALTNSGIQLVVIDPLNAFTPGLDMFKDTAIRPVLSALKRLAERHNVAILMIRHLTKSSREKALFRGQGSIGYSGAVRVEWYVTRDPDNPKRGVITNGKANLSPQGVPQVIFEIVDDGGSGRFEWRGVFAGVIDIERSLGGHSKPDGKQAQTREWLQAFLSEMPQTATSVQVEAEKAGFSWSTIRQVIKSELGIKSINQRNNPMFKDYVWCLPEQVDEFLSATNDAKEMSI